MNNKETSLVIQDDIVLMDLISFMIVRRISVKLFRQLSLSSA